MSKIFRITTLLWVATLFFLLRMGSAQEVEEKKPEVFELGEVVVTEKEEAVTLATTVTEVTEEDINAWGAQTVGEALDLIPGVDIQTGGKGQSFSLVE